MDLLIAVHITKGIIAMEYRVSYITGVKSSPGLLVTRQTYPQIGEEVVLEGKRCRVKEVVELSPRANEVQFLLVMVEDMTVGES
jgi:hypothetical protein